MSRSPVVSFYDFRRIDDPSDVVAQIHLALVPRQVLGTVIVAREGINATLAHAEVTQLAKCVDAIQRVVEGSTLACKWSWSDAADPAFWRLVVRVKKEIVKFGRELRAEDAVGVRIAPRDWNALLSDDNVIALDVRNAYESEVGSFAGAERLQLNRFSELDERVEMAELRDSGKAVAMYCTGGIRCEKASNALLRAGVKQVFQLDGGILGYLAATPREQRSWQGECFVFDQRVSLNDELQPGTYRLCRGCRRPLSSKDRASDAFELGVSCAHCLDEKTPQQRAGYQERVKQVELAAKRGERHIGPP